jgi:hypothetical protein
MTRKLASNAAKARNLDLKDGLGFAVDWLGFGEVDDVTESPVGDDPTVAVMPVVPAVGVEEG